MDSIFQALLVVENRETMGSVQNALSRLGCQILVAKTVEEGIEILKRKRIDIVVTELCIREKGGRSIARWIRDQCPNTRCFILTSWKGELEKGLLLLDGIHEVIHKPVSFSEIRDKVLKHFG